jgi:hypothetical protein
MVGELKVTGRYGRESGSIEGGGHVACTPGRSGRFGRERHIAKCNQV